MVLILIWNRPWPHWSQPLDCDRPCVVTTDRGRLADADAVVFHLPNLGRLDPADKLPGQKWVAWSMESNVYYPQVADPRILRHFDLAMTYRTESAVWVPYFGKDIAEQIHTPPKAKTAAAPAVYFSSNLHDRCGRQAYVRELMEHLPVDSYGRSLRNRRLAHDTGRETKLSIIAHYKFTLAFENSRSLDYVTEKLFDPLIAGSVPVYRGAPNVAEFAPGEHCLIDASEFDEPEDLAAYLRWLDENETAYREYLAWKARPLRPQFLDHLRRLEGNPFCRLCKVIVADRARTSGKLTQSSTSVRSTA